MSGAEARVERRSAVLAPLLADPDSAAILSDLDGTLAPIVARPELVVVPERGQRALERVAARFGLCAVITGRRPSVAREIVGIDGVAYAGNHGFEVLAPGATTAIPSPALAGHGEDAASFLAGNAGATGLERAGIRVEDKGPIVALHWRGAPDEAAAERLVEELAEVARSHDLITHAGRKVLELRPAVRIDKGIAIEALLEGTAVRAAFFAGDDRTDLDGFRALGRMHDDGRLDHVVRVAVRSEEGPAELVEEAELTVDDTDELIDLLAKLAG